MPDQVEVISVLVVMENITIYDYLRSRITFQIASLMQTTCNSPDPDPLEVKSSVQYGIT